MQFKNVVAEDKTVRSDLGYLYLSEPELKKYPHFKEKNYLEMTNIDYKIKAGNYVLKINDEEIPFELEEIDNEVDFKTYEVKFNGKVKRIERWKPVSKYDCIKAIVQNY